MRSCTIERPADTELDLYCLPLSSLLDDTYFATVPVIAVHPLPTSHDENEDELYTSFEQAISERAARISRQLSTLPLATHSRPLTTDALTLDAPLIGDEGELRLYTPEHARQARLHLGFRPTRRVITLACLALSLLLAGFDLMGLLVIAR
jgi:hypothetical protein